MVNLGLLFHKSKVEAVTRTLSSRLGAHAFLFYGDSGVGKYSAARAIAARLESEESELKFLSDSFFHDGGESSIGIDTIRSIREFIFLTPFKSKRRLVVINGAEAMTREAQGALLKLLEEPPLYGAVIIISSTPERLTDPVLSRLTKIYFPRLSNDLIKDYLKKSCNLSDKQAENLALLSFGSVRRADELLKAKTESNATDGVDFKSQLFEDILSLSVDMRGNSSRISRLLEIYCAASAYNLSPVIVNKLVGRRSR